MSDLSEKILKVSTVYLGPAAGMFLERQTKFHLNGIAFKDVQAEQLPELIKWIKISGKLVIDDKVDQLMAALGKELQIMA